MIEINSETDFCAKNEEFLKFVDLLAVKIIDKNLTSIDDLNNTEVNGSKIEDLRTQLVGKIGENITPRRFVNLESKGHLYAYIHGAKLGVILDMVGGTEELGKDISMHIAATKPKALDQSGIDKELLETERRVAIEKAKEAGATRMLERIAEMVKEKKIDGISEISKTYRSLSTTVRGRN